MRRREGTKRRTSIGGFTLIELLITVAIIGIIAAIAVPNLLAQVEKARITRVASDLKTFEKGFASYAIDAGEYPIDTHLVLPAGLEEYIPQGAWFAPTPLGGNYNWEGPDYYPYAGIALSDSDATLEQATKIDAILDDGDVTTGTFRLTPNGRYTYIIDE